MKYHLELIATAALSLSFSACHKTSHSKSTVPGDKSLELSSDLKASDYSAILGLSYGDTIDKANDLLGKPQEVSDESKYDFITNYYDSSSEYNQLSVSYYRDTKKIFTFSIDRENINFLRARGISDNRLAPLNKKLEDVVRVFGKSEDNYRADTPEYNAVVKDEKHIKVRFYCYDFYEYVCENFTLYWFK